MELRIELCVLDPSLFCFTCVYGSRYNSLPVWLVQQVFSLCTKSTDMLHQHQKCQLNPNAIIVWFILERRFCPEVS